MVSVRLVFLVVTLVIGLHDEKETLEPDARMGPGGHNDTSIIHRRMGQRGHDVTNNSHHHRSQVVLVNKRSALVADDQADAHLVPAIFNGMRARRASRSDVSELQDDSPVLLEPPSEEPYNFNENSPGSSYSQYGQDKLLAPIFADVPGEKFFVESGARDGESHSNTVFFEKQGWSGLLVEPSNMEFPRIQGKHRKAWAFHGCLSPTTSSELLHFGDDGNGLSHSVAKDEKPETFKKDFLSPAVPLAKLLEPLGKNTVDLWSLDIEGSEGPVLESTDLKKVEVGVFMIEMNKGEENNKRIYDVMQKNGFEEIGTTEYNGGDVLDRIFANPAYFEARGLAMPTHVDNPDHLR